LSPKMTTPDAAGWRKEGTRRIRRGRLMRGFEGKSASLWRSGKYFDDVRDPNRHSSKLPTPQKNEAGENCGGAEQPHDRLATGLGRGF